MTIEGKQGDAKGDAISFLITWMRTFLFDVQTIAVQNIIQIRRKNKNTLSSHDKRESATIKLNGPWCHESTASTIALQYRVSQTNILYRFLPDYLNHISSRALGSINCHDHCFVARYVSPCVTLYVSNTLAFQAVDRAQALMHIFLATFVWALSYRMFRSRTLGN